MNPLFSVIIPTYNREKLIIRAVKSVLSQSYKNFELIVIDDGSIDETAEVLKDLPLQYIKSENKGVSHARNLGVDSANGDWICFLDSDDEWKTNKLEVQLKYINDYPDISFFHTKECWMRDGKRISLPKKYDKGTRSIFFNSLGLTIISTGTVCMDKKLFLDLNGFNENFIVCEDFDLWLKVMAIGDIKYIDEELTVKHAGHGDQLSFNSKDLDYYRILSLVNFISNFKLRYEIKSEAIFQIKKKCKGLLKGITKNPNKKKEVEIQKILDFVS